MADLDATSSEQRNEFKECQYFGFYGSGPGCVSWVKFQHTRPWSSCGEAVEKMNWPMLETFTRENEKKKKTGHNAPTVSQC